MLASFSALCAAPTRQARADLMDEALSNYSRSMNEYYKGLSGTKTQEDRDKLSDRLLVPAGTQIQQALKDQTEKTLTKYGITVAKKGKEVKAADHPVVPLKNIQETVAKNAPTTPAVPAKRAPASGASPQIETPSTAPSGADAVVVSGEQKVDQTVYSAPEEPVAAPSKAPAKSAKK